MLIDYVKEHVWLIFYSCHYSGVKLSASHFENGRVHLHLQEILNSLLSLVEDREGTDLFQLYGSPRIYYKQATINIGAQYKNTQQD